MVSETSFCDGPIVPVWLGTLGLVVGLLGPIVVTRVLLARVRRRADTATDDLGLVTVRP